jgi:murein tripeptide amidase MpaA
LKTEVRFDRYYDIVELDDVLHRLASEHQGLSRVSSIGKSYEERDIWLMTLTDESTGADTEKPAFWMDGNMHASEVAGSMAALEMIHRLLEGYGTNQLITRLLKEMAFYVVPRCNPDGASLLFATPPRDIRSGTRPYPFAKPDDGLYEEDVDGDGRILTMRVEDPTGSWKVSDEDPRLMVPRAPFEEGGTYYRLYPEGRIRNFDGHVVRRARPLQGLDFNRNFPAGWAPEPVQHGAGPYPLSEAETRALAEFISSHRNINGAISYHTAGGVFFRPSSLRPDDDLPTHDVEVYKLLDEQTRTLTGYKAVSTWHEFSKSGRNVLHGGYLDWLYEEMGIFSFSPELWDYAGRAGVEIKDADGALQGWHYKHPVEDDLKVIQWLDREFGGRHLVPWRPFDHPELGKVEIGGVDGQFVFYNPPPEKLLDEISRTNAFCLLQASLSPVLAIRHFGAETIGAGVHRITLVAENTGFLPSYGSAQAKARGVVRPVRAELEGGEILGSAEIELGHMEGRSNKLRRQHSSETDNRARCEWLVRASPGQKLAVHVRSERAGSRHASLTIS